MYVYQLMERAGGSGRNVLCMCDRGASFLGVHKQPSLKRHCLTPLRLLLHVQYLFSKSSIIYAGMPRSWLKCSQSWKIRNMPRNTDSLPWECPSPSGRIMSLQCYNSLDIRGGSRYDKSGRYQMQGAQSNHVYIKSTTVCVPLSELGLSQPLSRQGVCPSLQNRGGGGAHSPAGEGLGKSHFRRLEKKLSTLPTLWQGGKTGFWWKTPMKPVLLRLSLAGNLEKPLTCISLYGTEWREREYGLWQSVWIHAWLYVQCFPFECMDIIQYLVQCCAMILTWPLILTWCSRAVLWNEEDSMWYDYNYKTKRQNRYTVNSGWGVDKKKCSL